MTVVIATLLLWIAGN